MPRSISYEDALNHIRRLETQGAHSIKNYNQPRRNQRQQVAAAARAENIIVVPEGGSLFQMDISLIQDGNTTVEHNLPQLRLYEDVVSLWSQTQVGNNPTLVVTYGGLAGDPYWSQATQVWNHPLLSRHTPPNELAGRVRAVTAPPEQFVDQYEAREAHRLYAAGVPIAIGGHGQQPGIAEHWELWSHVRGGATPLEALRHGHRRSGPALRLCRHRHARAGQIGRPRHPRRQSARGHPQQRPYFAGDAQRPALRCGELNEVVTGNRQRQPYFWEDGQGTGARGETVAREVD